MKNRWWIVAGVLLGLLLPIRTIQAQGLPTLVEGQYVYTIPEGFVPPRVGLDGMDQIETQLDHLHYPFYVVFVERVPSFDTTQYADFVSSLVREWQARQPTLLTPQTSVFVVRYEPRGKVLLAGSQWVTDLQLSGVAALDRFVQRFNIYARTNSPVGIRDGVSALLREFDTYVFDYGNPERIAERYAQDAECQARESERWL